MVSFTRLLRPVLRLATLVSLVALVTSAAHAQAQPSGSSPWLVMPTRLERPTHLSGSPRMSYSNPSIAPVVEGVARRSPFLRRQLERLLSDERVLLSLAIVDRRSLRAARAVTRLDRLRDGRLRAEIALGLDIDVAELLGHELEHVIERLDGVDVARALARQDRSVHHSHGHAFETARAQLAGRIVSAENAGRRMEVQP